MSSLSSEEKREYKARYYLRNKEKINKKNNENYLKNKKKRNAQSSEYYYAHREHLLSLNKISGREYYQKNKKKKQDYKKNQYAINEEFRKKVNTRNKSRRLISLKGKCCAICGSKENLQRHHPDYDKPEYAIIICGICHPTKHQKIREVLKCQV
jgi:hypothetical protein